MPLQSRAVRTAREVIRSERPRIPVPVEKIAQKYAIIVREALPPDISGMLVPLASGGKSSRWAIVVNKADPKVRQRFTIAHELGHLLIHKYSSPHADGRVQVRFRDEKSSSGSVREEIEANRFAAELLMPEREVRTSASRLQFDLMDARVDAEALQSLTAIARKFRVSVQALSFRIANLGIG